MAGKGGGAWKVAYADFVTAMMAFFLVMWITGQSKEVKEAVAQYFNDPFGMSFGRSKAESEAPSHPEGGGGGGARRGQPPGRNAAGAPSKPPPGQKRRGWYPEEPSLLVLHDGEKAMLGTVVWFAEQSAQLGQEARQQLDRLVPALLGKRNKIELRGHATRRPPPPGAPFRDAWQLSYARCLSVMEYLERAGVEAERIRLSQAGPFEPQTIRLEPGWEKENSRVEVYVLGLFADDLVGTREERSERSKTP